MESTVNAAMLDSKSSRRSRTATILTGDPASATQLLSNALTLRRAGIHFALAIQLEDARARVIRARSVELCAGYGTWDEVRLMLDQFDSSQVTTRDAMPAGERTTLLEAARLADSLVIRSWAEFQRLTACLETIPRDAEIFVQPDSDVPEPAGDERSDIVVYAPRYRADELAPFITALADVKVPVTFIARDRPTIATAARFESPQRSAAALGRARVIVDANGDDPGVSVALAKFGRPLVVASHGGAPEILRGAWTYQVWDRRSILGAVASAMASPAPSIRGGPWERHPRRIVEHVFPRETPLVSIIVPTYNRPDLLGHALATVQRQTYPQLEIIVVNDGGCDVRAVVARFPRARLVECERNGGPGAARNVGLREARGTFVSFFDDDDEMFPDHIASLVQAIDVSGFDVAYGQLINAFVASREDGSAITGFAGQKSVLDHADMQWAGSLAPTAILFRRSLIEHVGGIDASLPIAEDYDFWLRLTANRECARVDAVTSIYFIPSDGANYSRPDGTHRHSRAHRAIYAKHPSDRPLVNAGRAAMLEYFNNG